MVGILESVNLSNSSLQKKVKYFWYLLPTIMIQPPGKHYPGYAKVYIAWLNIYIMIGNLPEEE
jgi:hypothetical protein